MTERITAENLPVQGKIAHAMGLYQRLLDHYHINKKAQHTVWVTVLEGFKDNPGKMIEEIQGYWETAFGVNGSGNNNSKKSDAENALNDFRQKWRNDSYRIAREGSITKAQKKANGRKR